MLKGLIRSCIVPHMVVVFICTSCSALPAVVLDGNLDDLRKRTEIRERRGGGLRHLLENYPPHLRDSVLFQDDLTEPKIVRPPSPQKVVTVHMFNFTDLISSPLFMSPHLSFRRTALYPSHGQDLYIDFSKTLREKSRSKRSVHAGQEVSVCDEKQEYKHISEPLNDYKNREVEVLQSFITPDLNKGEVINQFFAVTTCNDSRGSEGGCRGIDKAHWTSSCVTKKSNVPAIVRIGGKLEYTFIAINTSCNCALKKKPRSANSEFIKAERTMCDIFQQTLAEVTKEQEKAEGEGQGRGEVGEIDTDNGRKTETSTASGSADDAQARKERRRHQKQTSKESKKSRRRRKRRRQRSRERRTRRRQDNPPTDLSSQNNKRTPKRSRQDSD
ncbi:brain-derived neurotrophic factor-like isoform X1 [Branchiostoma floridae]|uniref:Brain-derived neurotrophic factor-like isoform X1 n=3 Tax=Branchiostoma floridae TaxID=7739 RepID=A0A9J7KAF6_BRAFL|nr:brain-derived neurotrophic factor-like isoform X1 [Branchiostoma floridae]